MEAIAKTIFSHKSLLIDVGFDLDRYSKAFDSFSGACDAENKLKHLWIWGVVTDLDWGRCPGK